MKKKYLIPAVLITACSTLALGACGSQSSSTSGAQTTPTAQPASSATPQPTLAVSSQSPSPIAMGQQTPTAGSGAGSDNGNSAQTLQKIVSAAQSSVSQLNTSGAYSNVTLTAKGSNTLVYTFTLKNAGTTKQQLESERSTMENMFKSILSMMEEAGINNPIISIVWNNPDGSNIDTMNFAN